MLMPVEVLHEDMKIEAGDVASLVEHLPVCAPAPVRSQFHEKQTRRNY